MIIFQVIIEEEKDTTDVNFTGSMIQIKAPPTKGEQLVMDLVGVSMNWVAEEVSKATKTKPIIEEPYQPRGNT